MTFRDELEQILTEFIGYPKEDDITSGFDHALTSIINLVDKDIIGSNIESDHQMSHRQGKAIQRNKLKEISDE